MLRKREGKLIFTQMKGLCFNCGFQNMTLTVQDARTASPYRWAALPKSTKTHRPPELRSHQGPVSSAACTAGNQKKKRSTLSIIVDQWAGCLISRWSVSRPPTWMMLCMWGMRRSMRTSSNMTRARHTFFRTSESSSAARANRLYARISIWHNKRVAWWQEKKKMKEKLTFTALPHGGTTHLYEGVNVVH